MDAADRILQDLVDAFGYTGYLSKLDGDSIILLRVRQGAYPLRHVREVGTRLPALCTAMGRALLARQDDEAIRDLCRRCGTGESDSRDLAASIAQARRTGVLAMASALTPGISTVTSTVSDPDRGECMAIALAYPDSAVDATRVEAMRHCLRQTARDLGLRLGDAAWVAEGEQADSFSSWSLKRRESDPDRALRMTAEEPRVELDERMRRARRAGLRALVGMGGACRTPNQQAAPSSRLKPRKTQARQSTTRRRVTSFQGAPTRALLLFGGNNRNFLRWPCNPLCQLSRLGRQLTETCKWPSEILPMKTRKSVAPSSYSEAAAFCIARSGPGSKLMM